MAQSTTATNGQNMDKCKPSLFDLTALTDAAFEALRSTNRQLIKQLKQHRRQQRQQQLSQRPQLSKYTNTNHQARHDTNES